MGGVPLRYRFVMGLKKWFASIFSWFASAVYWVESAHSCSVTFFECHYDTNDYWGTGCGYLKKIIFASFKNGNICDQTIEFIFLQILLKFIFRSIYLISRHLFSKNLIFRIINFLMRGCFFGQSTAFRYSARKFRFFKFQIFFGPILRDISPRKLWYFQFSFFGGSLIFRPINCIKTFFLENSDFSNFHVLVGVCSYNLL